LYENSENKKKTFSISNYKQNSKFRKKSCKSRNFDFDFENLQELDQILKIPKLKA